jgi:hypothetical protein
MSAWKDYKKKLGDSRPWDIIDKNNYTDEQTAADRYAICEECPKFIPLSRQCKECGCFMNLKTKLKNATCPIGKW